MIGRTFAHYRIIEPLGAGGMGEVYRARDQHLDLAPEFKPLASDDRFVRALAVARAQFDDTVALLREAERRSELPPFLQQPLEDLLRVLGIDSS